MEIEIEVVNKSTNPLPKYALSGDSGMDVIANETVVVKSMCTVMVDTGLSVAIPDGYEIQVRPRSGLSAKTSIRVANSPGTVDANFRGTIKVIVSNYGPEDYTINFGDRIAQFVLAEVPKIKWKLVESLSDSVRGENGFGSTGK